jgi:hypothetical protein
MQSIVIKDGKNNHIVWDGSMVTQPTYIVMNQVTPVAQEAPVMFGHVKSQIYMDIYNMRISCPTATTDLTGAFSFIASGKLYNLATAMVFGSTVSAPS